MAKSDRIERRIKLHDIRVLMSVVKAGSMSRAAEDLGTAQPALSRSIAELERALGVRLLDRGPRGVQPTIFGRALVSRGIAALDELRQGIKDIEHLADPTAGELRIGATEAIAGAIVAPLIEELSRKHPQMEFHIVTGDLGRQLGLLSERSVDFALSRLHTRIDDSRFATETLFHDSYVIVAGKRSPWSRRRKIAVSDLVDQRWTLLPSDTLPGTLMTDAFRASGLERPRVAVSTLSLNVHNRLLATGRFLSVQPEFLSRLPGWPASLRILPIALPGTRRPICAVSLKHRSLSPLAQLFLERLRAFVRPLAGA